MKAIIYHNPRCSKSRQTLALLTAHGVDVEIIEYLEQPPDRARVRELLRALGLAPREIVRRGESTFSELGLAAHLENDDAMLDALVAHPALLQRPIVLVGARAVLGRPPDNVLALIAGAPT